MSVLEEERRQFRRQQSFEQNPWRVLSIREWCELNGFSLATGRRLIERGEGPVVVQLSPRRCGVTIRANADWQAQRARSTE
jgi:predicted DNA-binding transcriptional regulator AlpA